MATEPEHTPTSDRWACTTEEWAASRYHRVVMPTGRRAVIQLPTLGMLALANAVPDELIELARAEFTHALGAAGKFAEQLTDALKGEDREKAEQAAQAATRDYNRLLRWLVAEHVLVEPKVTVEQLSDETVPIEDLEWLYGVATRRVSEDAAGRRLGVARLDEFATFRDKHGCGPDCEHCLELVDALSTTDLGAL